jgi:predicted 3-demethylubiquinone-9 3-methyltransferase (glyoxalase superfamily)
VSFIVFDLIEEHIVPRITPFLWFENQAEEAVNFYTSIFKNSKIGKTLRCGDAGPGPKGSVLTMSFEIAGQQFTALNGGPHDKFNDSVSFVVHCQSQEEVDFYWDKLTADGGKEVQCGWLKDKFGVSWQIVPDKLFDLIDGQDGEKSARAMQAMMQIVKLDVNKLQAAYDGR